MRNLGLKIKVWDNEYIISSYPLYSIIIGIGNVIFSDSLVIGMFFSFGQILYLLFSFFTGDKSRAVCNMFISMALAQEYEIDGVSLCYSVKSIRFLGVNLIFWVLFVFSLSALCDNKLLNKLLSRSSGVLEKLVKYICFLNLMGFILGIINIYIVNDNNVKAIPGYTRIFFEMIYSFVGLTVFPIIILFSRYLYDENFIKKIKESIIGMFIALFASIAVALAFGKYQIGFWGMSINVSVISMYLPYIILYPFYKETKKKLQWLMIGLIGFVIGIYYFPGGKGMLSLIPLSILLLLLLLKHRNRNIGIFIIGIVMPLGIGGLLLLKDKFSNAVLSKWNYVLALLGVTNENWWNMIPASPKWRIVEFINIIKEFIQKPHMMLFGKGYMGTVRDYTGYLSQFSGDLSGAEAGEWATGLFYSMHETINRIFLENGIIGLIIVGWILYIMIKNYDVSPYIFIGGFWFVFFWGYSIQIAALGIPALFVGFAEIADKNKVGFYQSAFVNNSGCEGGCT